MVVAGVVLEEADSRQEEAIVVVVGVADGASRLTRDEISDSTGGQPQQSNEKDQSEIRIALDLSALKAPQDFGRFGRRCCHETTASHVFPHGTR